MTDYRLKYKALKYMVKLRQVGGTNRTLDEIVNDPGTSQDVKEIFQEVLSESGADPWAKAPPEVAALPQFTAFLNSKTMTELKNKFRNLFWTVQIQHTKHSQYIGLLFQTLYYSIEPFELYPGTNFRNDLRKVKEEFTKRQIQGDNHAELMTNNFDK